MIVASLVMIVASLVMIVASLVMIVASLVMIVAYFIVVRDHSVKIIVQSLHLKPKRQRIHHCLPFHQHSLRVWVDVYPPAIIIPHTRRNIPHVADTCLHMPFSSPRYKNQHVIWVDEEEVLQKLNAYVARKYRDSFCQPECLTWAPPSLESGLLNTDPEETSAAAVKGNGHSHGAIGNGGDGSAVVAESSGRRKVAGASPRYVR
jgi:hypothetical protein